MYNSKVGTRLFEYIETVKKDSVDYFIAKALLEKLDDFPDIVIEEIAYKANTTPSSITKFVKKLGYESFKEMRYDIGEYSSKLLVDSFQVSSLSQYLKDFHQMELDYDEKIIQSIDHQIIMDLVEKINNANTILILQASYNHNIISFLSEILTAMGKKVISINRSNTDSFILNNIKNADVVILTSLTGKYISERKSLLKTIQIPLYIISGEKIEDKLCIYPQKDIQLFGSYYHSQRYIYMISLLIHYYLKKAIF